MGETFGAYVLEEQGPPVPRQLSGQILAGRVRGRVVTETGR
jgi:hypothetical protein